MKKDSNNIKSASRIPFTRDDRRWQLYALNDALVRAPRAVRETADKVCKLINNAEVIERIPSDNMHSATYVIQGFKLVLEGACYPNTQMRYGNEEIVKVCFEDEQVALITKPWLVYKIVSTLDKKIESLEKAQKQRKLNLQSVINYFTSVKELQR